MFTDRLKELQKLLTELIQEADTLDSEKSKDEIVKELKDRYGDSGYVSPYPVLFARLHIKVRQLNWRVENLNDVMRDVDLAERLLNVMERFEVYANIGFRGEDNTRELRLLELLATSDKYDYERRQLQGAIQKALDDVQEQESEAERDNAIEKIHEAGFETCETDDFDGYVRMSGSSDERIRIDINQTAEKFGYEFSYEVDGQVVAEGQSGEFNKLLEAVGAVPKAA